MSNTRVVSSMAPNRCSVLPLKKRMLNKNTDQMNYRNPANQHIDPRILTNQCSADKSILSEPLDFSLPSRSRARLNHKPHSRAGSSDADSGIRSDSGSDYSWSKASPSSSAGDSPRQILIDPLSFDVSQSPINRNQSIHQSAFTPIKLPNLSHSDRMAVQSAPQAKASEVPLDFMQLLMTMGVFSATDLLQLSLLTSAQTNPPSVPDESMADLSITPNQTISDPKSQTDVSINNQVPTIVAPSTARRIVKAKSPIKAQSTHPSPRKQLKMTPQARNLASLTKEISEKARKREAAAEMRERSVDQDEESWALDLEGSMSGDDADQSSSSYVINPATGNKVRRNYKNMTRERRIEANARERCRVHTIGSAFDSLRALVPAVSEEQKLSKLSILRIACSYIMLLGALNGKDYSEDQHKYSVEQCMDMLNETISIEGKSLKRTDPVPTHTQSPCKRAKPSPVKD